MSRLRLLFISVLSYSLSIKIPKKKVSFKINKTLLTTELLKRDLLRADREPALQSKIVQQFI